MSETETPATIKPVATIGELRDALASYPAEMPVQVLLHEHCDARRLQYPIQGVIVLPGWYGGQIVRLCIESQNAPFPFTAEAFAGAKALVEAAK